MQFTKEKDIKVGACYLAIYSVLLTHSNLNKSNIKFIVDYVTNLYSNNIYNSKKNEMNNLKNDYVNTINELENSKIFPNKSFDLDNVNFFNKTLSLAKNSIDEHQLIQFLTFANLNTMGRYAFSYNMELENAIIMRDTFKIKKLLQGPQNMFVEIYDNPFLSLEESNFLIKKLVREIYTTSLTLEQIRLKLLNESDFNQINHSYYDLNHLCNLYSCQEIIFNGNNTNTAIFLTNDIPKDKIYVIDKSPHYDQPLPYHLNFLEVLDSFIKSKIKSEHFNKRIEPINPETKKPFCLKTQSDILNNYHFELCMYHRFLLPYTNAIKLSN